MVFDLCKIACGKLLRDGQSAQQSAETLQQYASSIRKRTTRA
ncbi:MAG: hypothetical protein QM770_17660 [Tepidisphaeraceae bacterium]